MTHISVLFRLLHSGCEIRTALHICATVARRGNFGRDGDHRHSADAALCRTLPPLSGSYYRVHLNWMGESRDQIGRGIIIRCRLDDERTRVTRCACGYEGGKPVPLRINKLPRLEPPIWSGQTLIQDLAAAPRFSIRFGAATERMGGRVVGNTSVQSSAFRKSSLKARAISSTGAIRQADPDTSDISSGSRRAPTVLHASFDGRRLLLWAETRWDYAGLSGHGRRQRGTAPPPSPYDAGGTALLAALDQCGVLRADCPVGTVVISLPSLNGAPLASSGLVATPPDSVDKAVLQPWTVSAVAMTWSTTIELLCICAGRRTPALGVIVGEDLAYWTAAMRLAAALVARQHLLPDIVEEDGAFVARWRPVPTHSEAQAMAQLEAAMPDTCRALGADRAPPAPHGATILSGFFERVVDHLARANGSSAPRAAHAQFDSLDAQWLDALQRADPSLRGDRAALLALKQRVQAWWRPIAIGAASPFRLCFRLEEPATIALEEPEIVAGPTPDEVSNESAVAADGPWHLRYLLQAHHDPSLLVTASTAWSARGREAQPFARNGFNVREFILQSLGQAARICPPIEDSLRGGIPDAHQLDAAAATRFLTEQAGVLEQAGFGRGRLGGGDRRQIDLT